MIILWSARNSLIRLYGLMFKDLQRYNFKGRLIVGAVTRTWAGSRCGASPWASCRTSSSPSTPPPTSWSTVSWSPPSGTRCSACSPVTPGPVSSAAVSRTRQRAAAVLSAGGRSSASRHFRGRPRGRGSSSRITGERVNNRIFYSFLQFFAIFFILQDCYPQ